MDDHRRRVNGYRLGRASGDTSPAPEPEADAAREDARTAHRGMWVELQIRQAMDRGDFDDLPGAGKPIPDLGTTHDPDWWIKRLIRREQIDASAVLPPALALRVEDATLEETLDKESTEADVRRLLDDFNARIVSARRQLLGGPPVITALRDVDAECAAWAARRAERLREARAAAAQREREARRGSRRWFRRRPSHD